MNYALAIKAARNRAKITQAELADRCGLATITIRQYESGKREPRMEQLSRIADALGISVGTLLRQEPSGIEGLKSGLISPADIADELNIPVDLVWRSIQEPETVPRETRDKIGAVGAMLTLTMSEPANLNAAESLKKISYSLHRLNEDGQRTAVERVAELTDIPKYRRQG